LTLPYQNAVNYTGPMSLGDLPDAVQTQAQVGNTQPLFSRLTDNLSKPSFPCPFNDCSYSSIGLKRNYELKRHLKTHGPGEFACHATNCDRHDKKAFKRRDKLKAHMVKKHAGSIYTCPKFGCAETAKFEDLKVHILGHGRDHYLQLISLP